MTIEDQLKEAARQGAALALQAAGVYMKQTDAAALAGKDRRTVGNWKRTGKVRADLCQSERGHACNEALNLIVFRLSSVCWIARRWVDRS